MLAYGSKVVLPVEVALCTHHLTTFQEELNNKALQEVLDLLLSVRGDDLLIEMLYKLRIALLHDHTVKLHFIKFGSLVLHQTKVVVQAGEHGKFIANWGDATM